MDIPIASILFITRKWPPAIGGMETYSIKLTTELNQTASVEVLALPGRASGQPPSTFALLGYAISTFVRLLLRRTSPSVVHIGDLSMWPLGSVARLRFRGARTVISAHGTDVAYGRRKTFRGYLYWLYLLAGAKCMGSCSVIANSKATAYETERYGFRRVVVVPLATDLKPVEPVPKLAGHLLFAGRLIARKGCSWFVRNVLPLLPAEVHLHVAGPIWDDTERTVLSFPRVKYLGNLSAEELRVQYASALCVVSPNVELPNGEIEGFGLSALEAAACGGISLAARTTGMQEALIDGVTGFQISPGDEKAWAATIAHVRSWDTERRAVFVTHALAECEERFSWKRVAKETLSAYQDAL